ncbi:MAG TPA: DUF3795 domain-containing protein [Bacteroidota bacterium]|nr:DUF3795 domain-containing protein [Bacteroidota bacterium]
MITQERLQMVAPCGIDCGICELYTCKENSELYERLIERGFPKEKIPCEGCRGVEGNCPVIPEKCATYVCVQDKGVQFCYECGEFPCDKLQPSADRANVLPHNCKVFNLCVIQRDGVEQFTQQSGGIKQKYYAGKMVIGSGPKVE